MTKSLLKIKNLLPTKMSSHAVNSPTCLSQMKAAIVVFATVMRDVEEH